MAHTSTSFWVAHSTPTRAPKGQGQGVLEGSWVLGGGSSGAVVGFAPVAKLHCSLEPPGSQHRLPEGSGCRWNTPGCPHPLPLPTASQPQGTPHGPPGDQAPRAPPGAVGTGSSGAPVPSQLRAWLCRDQAKGSPSPPTHQRFQTMAKLRHIPVPGPASKVPQALPTRRSPRAVPPGGGRLGVRSGAPGAPTCRPAQTKRGRAPARCGAMRRAGAGTGGGGPGTPPPPSRRPRPPLCTGAPGPAQVAGGGRAARGAQRRARSR